MVARSSYVSVLTIVAFSMERYLAICHPLHLHAMSGLKRPMRFILGSWMVALVSAIPFAVYMKVDYIDYPEGLYKNVSLLPSFRRTPLHGAPRLR